MTYKLVVFMLMPFCDHSEMVRVIYKLMIYHFLERICLFYYRIVDSSNSISFAAIFFDFSSNTALIHVSDSLHAQNKIDCLSFMKVIFQSLEHHTFFEEMFRLA
jgi:hypothetical protein